MDAGRALALAKRVIAGEPIEGYQELYTVFLELRVLFSKSSSWYERALARAILGVRQVGEGHWLVPSLPGDYHAFYNVWLSAEGKYKCDCHSRTFGSSREKSICTHVAGVIISRRWEKLKRDLGLATS
ncbi:MAG: hypothetical protein QW291_07955 [Thermofilaceae archaeon]